MIVSSSTFHNFELLVGKTLIYLDSLGTCKVMLLIFMLVFVHSSDPNVLGVQESLIFRLRLVNKNSVFVFFVFVFVCGEDGGKSLTVGIPSFLSYVPFFLLTKHHT